MTKSDAVVWTPGDWHSGSNTSLTLPEWTWGDGITTKQSKTQSIIRQQHFENLELIKEARKKKRLIVTFAGDAVDGNHHGTTQIMTVDENEHARLFVALFEEALEYLGFNPKHGDTLRFLLGTKSHVGNLEEVIAKYFYDEWGDEAVPPLIKPTAGGRYRDGVFVRPKTLLDINGVLFDIAHEPPSGPGTRAWTKENGIRNVVKSKYWTCLEYREPIPYWWIRAHRHQFVRSGRYHGEHGSIEGLLLPAKQAKTHYGHRKASESLSNLGDVWFTVDKDGYSKLYKNFLKYNDEIEVERA